MGYTSPLLSFPDMFDWLLATGRKPENAAHELEQALADGALALIDLSNPSRGAPDLAVDGIAIIRAYQAKDRAAANPYLLARLKNVRARRTNFEKVFGLGDAAVSEPKTASVSLIRTTIARVYDDAESSGAKPPNINELPEFVRKILNADGYDATGLQIKRVGDEPAFKTRRGAVGRRTH